MINYYVNNATGEVVRYMQNDIISIPSMEKGSKLYFPKKSVWIASLSNRGNEYKQTIFAVDYTDPNDPFVRSLFVSQIARIDESGTSPEQRKRGQLVFSDGVNMRVHKARAKNVEIDKLTGGKILEVVNTKIAKVHKYDSETRKFTDEFEDRTAYQWEIKKAENIDDNAAAELIKQYIAKNYTVQQQETNETIEE